MAALLLDGILVEGDRLSKKWQETVGMERKLKQNARKRYNRWKRRTRSKIKKYVSVLNAHLGPTEEQTQKLTTHGLQEGHGEITDEHELSMSEVENTETKAFRHMNTLAAPLTSGPINSPAAWPNDFIDPLALGLWTLPPSPPPDIIPPVPEPCPVKEGMREIYDEVLKAGRSHVDAAKAAVDYKARREGEVLNRSTHPIIQRANERLVRKIISKPAKRKFYASHDAALNREMKKAHRDAVYDAIL